MKRSVLAGFAAALSLAAVATGAEVGFSEVKVENGIEEPLVVGLWYPTAAPVQDHRLGPYSQRVALDSQPSGNKLPLVVMSHGNGGSYQNHLDTALALAEAGFVVAAVSHTGDTFNDQSRALAMADRPRHIGRLIDYVSQDWAHRERVDGERVGAFGFSSGGFTALVLLGGKPDISLVDVHVRSHPLSYEALLQKRAGSLAAGASPGTWLRDPRIKAAVVVAPALGYTFADGGLSDVTAPVQLWRAQEDRILPDPDYAEAVRRALPRPAEFHSVPNADHFDFLAPCSEDLKRYAPAICASRPGFDRTAFHAAFNREVVRFFGETLR